MAILLTNDDEHTILDSECGYIVCFNSDEYNTILLKEKNTIKKRECILERFEHWELKGIEKEKINHLHRLLISRCRNESEEKIVKIYIKCLKEI